MREVTKCARCGNNTFKISSGVITITPKDRKPFETWETVFSCANCSRIIIKTTGHLPFFKNG